MSILPRLKKMASRGGYLHSDQRGNQRKGGIQVSWSLFKEHCYSEEEVAWCFVLISAYGEWCLRTLTWAQSDPHGHLLNWNHCSHCTGPCGSNNDCTMDPSNKIRELWKSTVYYLQVLEGTWLPGVHSELAWRDSDTESRHRVLPSYWGQGWGA